MSKYITVKNLNKHYWKSHILKNVNFELNKWECLWFIWHNWAWKTTTIWIMTDLVEKTAWNVKIFWKDIDKDFASAKTFIWVVPQEFNFNIFEKVNKIPVHQAGYYGIDRKTAEKRTKKLLQELELWEHRNKDANELSGWMKRRLMIARALVHKPKFLILDEPTAWVDVELRKTMWDFIKKLNEDGTTILLTTHYLEEVEALCNKVAIINDWKIVENTTTKKLLSSLDEEVFVLDLAENKKPSEDIIKKLKAFSVQKNKEWGLEVTISRKHRLNKLFEILNKDNIIISSMRNKVNRIEQLFMNLTK